MSEKFYEMNKFPGYTININGEIQDPNGNLLKPFIACSALYYKIGNRGYSAAKLVWETFIGEINTYIRYSDGNEFNVNIQNLYVDLDIEKLSSNKYRINDISFQVIPGFSAYVISRKGTVYSLKRRQFVARSFNHAGYPTVALVDDNGFRSPRKVHRLVYLTYIGELNPNLVIDHIDVNNLNPEVENLRQISQRENVYRTFNRVSNQHEFTRDVTYEDIIIDKYSSVFNIDDIIQICKLLVDNMSHDEILSRLHLENTRYNYNLIVSLTTKLRNREIYEDIANKYNVPERLRFGSGPSTAMFSQSDKKFIIEEFMRGRPQQSLATLFGATQSAISLIVKKNIKDLIDVEGSTTIERVS